MWDVELSPLASILSNSLTIFQLPRFIPLRGVGAGAFEHDFDAAVLRPAVRVSFEATGCVSPNPLAEMTFGLTPCDWRYATTLSARREDRSMLLAIPARFSGGRPAGCRYSRRRRLWRSAGPAAWERIG